MTEQTIKCPYCKKDILLTEALTHQIQERVRYELGVEVEKKEKDLEKREAELVEKVKTVENSQKNINEEINRKLEIEKQTLLKKALQEAEGRVSLELKDLREQIQEKDKKIEESEEKELELRKKQREIDAREKSLELDMTRKLDSERKKIEEETSKRISEEQGLKLLEREETIAGLKKQIDELKRRAEVGSQQLQGEVQELDLESFLQEHFIYDELRPVPKGIRGADVLQKISTKNETDCGSILWESKRTKNWSEGWITKLKEDQREAKADIAVIVSDILPKDVSNAGFRNGVWITNRASLHGLAMALRKILTEVAFTKLAAEGKDEKIELLFRYLTGPEFRQRVEAMIETFVAMKQDLDKEKRATIARWGKQEKQIEKIVAVTAGMHGDLRGLIGSSMQSIPALESGDEKTTEVENKKTEDEEDNEVDIKDIPF
ncbi:DUF2130 domain-containing protein [Candidatus Parcubacteria bacterium]|uniref:DUF2130 domain-containing protein n=1 Tax=Candidatus Jorgensenbacteria bacterium CG11_big_fil_rev_8_21_14_0_20_38_23 TaxID=1974594 RepID=A0A2H0NEN7_9BACT|nr:DUF2130 domain-containing protein [Candidatus Parcubacteria bacterium]PIR07351.1 MAG: hypothetical protein COV54_01410 [Candidatus Jorgensenbacteria bacterium CG11_big_fil_rev_8_21_14_0_20_38_23]